MSFATFSNLAPVKGMKPPTHNFTVGDRSAHWQFVDEHITAVGSETYPWDETIVKAIRRFEPDFMPLWCTTVYASPTGALYTFGRHVLALGARHHVQEGKHQDLKVWPAVYGVNAGLRPISIQDVLQDKSVVIIPELSVYGYRPFDWGIYHLAKRAHWESLRHGVDESDRDAQDIYREYLDNRAEEERKRDDEADYRFEHAGGIKAVKDLPNLTTADWGSLAERQSPKPFIHLKGNA